MGKYLDTRKKKLGPTAEKKKPFALNMKFPEEKVPDMKTGEVHVEYEKQSFWDKLLGVKYDKKEEPDEEDEILVDDEGNAVEVETSNEEVFDEDEEPKLKKKGKKRSIFKKLKQSFGKSTHVHFYGEDGPGVDQDLKEVLKVTHKWIEKLPPAKIKEFKESSDFLMYKDILEKYGLIKKKGEEVKPVDEMLEPEEEIKDESPEKKESKPKKKKSSKKKKKS